MAELNDSPRKDVRVTITWDPKLQVFRARAVGLQDIVTEGTDRLSALHALERLLEIVGRYAKKCAR